jgi:hypothetical protein
MPSKRRRTHRLPMFDFGNDIFSTRPDADPHLTGAEDTYPFAGNA